MEVAHSLCAGPPPFKREIPFRMSGHFLSGWKVEWMPVELGVHTIDVKYGDKHVVGSPFRCRVYDLTKVRLYRDEMSEQVDLDGIPGEDIVFFGKPGGVSILRYSGSCLIRICLQLVSSHWAVFLVVQLILRCGEITFRGFQISRLHGDDSVFDVQRWKGGRNLSTRLQCRTSASQKLTQVRPRIHKL